MTRLLARDVFAGCYPAHRAAALAGMPETTVYDWARKGIVVPSISQERPKLWSYADLMALRIVSWIRHAKGEIPASPMSHVREVLGQLERDGIDLWAPGPNGHETPLLVDQSGRLLYRSVDGYRDAAHQGVLEVLDVLGPFDIGESQGPDLRRPRPHLRIIPGKVSGEPHLEDSRLTTAVIAALAERGFDLDEIADLYPAEDIDAIAEAIDLEKSLAA